MGDFPTHHPAPGPRRPCEPRHDTNTFEPPAVRDSSVGWSTSSRDPRAPLHKDHAMTSPVFMPPGSDTADLLPLTKTGKLSAKKLKNLTREEAKALTREIQGRTTPHLWLLVERAHDGRACDVLGFNNWKDYTERELEISESRSFQLLDQAKVMRELAAAGHNVMELEPVPARVVAKVKNSLPQVRETARTALEDGQDVHQAIRALAQTLYAAREPQAVREPRRPATRTPAAGEAICPCCNGQGVVPALTAKLIVQFLEAST